MRYRELGNTGLKVSEIALGCEGFNKMSRQDTERMFSVAFDHGVNCMDLYSPNPDLHRRISGAVNSRREDFILQAHLCSMWDNGQYRATRNLCEVDSAFEQMMNNLQTDYLDIGMIHYVDSLSAWQQIREEGVLDYAKKLKCSGRIRHLGVSSHNPVAALAAVESGEIEVLMFSINPCYDLLPGDEDCERLWDPTSYEKPLFNLDPQRERLYETCQQRGVGITVMKAFGGGDLLHEKYSPAGRSMTAIKCLHYALTRPAVACIMCGVHSPQELLDSLAYETASAEDKDYAEIFASFPKISWQGHCMYCGHCAPCPKGIDIATVTKFLNLARSQGEVPETVREHYAALPAKAGDCLACRACEKRCPFSVAIVENMQAAKQIFGA